MVHARLLFVCTGNVCRSPSAEWVVAAKAAQAGLTIKADSAGTISSESGNPPSPLAIQAARARGYEINDHIARPLVSADYRKFDLLLGMTDKHVNIMTRLAPPGSTARIAHFMTYAAQHTGTDIKDPWDGDRNDYDLALDMIEEGADGLIEHLRSRLRLNE